MRHFKYSFFLSLFLILAVSGSAWAAIDADGAQKLKNTLEKSLSRTAEELKKDNMELLQDGRLMVEPSGTYYSVTYPRISLKMEDGSRIDLGMVSANVMPGDKPELWKIALALPSPMTYYDKAGNPSFMFSIGKQFFSGIWHEKFENYIYLKADYQNIKAVSADHAFNLLIPNMTINYDLKQNDKGLWSGPIDFGMKDMQVAIQGGGAAKIGRIGYKTMITDFSIEAQRAFKDQMSALTESYGAGEDSMSSAHIAGIYNLVFDYIGNSMDSFTSSLEAENVEIHSPASQNQAAGKIALNKAGFSFDMGGFQKNQVSMRLGMNYVGLSISPPPDSMSEVTPDTVDLDIVINNLPYKEVVGLGRNSLLNASQNPGAAQIVGMQALMNLPQLFTKAGTSINITDIFFSGSSYAAKASGNFVANMNAVNGLTGQAHTEIAGLETLISLLAREAQNPATSEAARQSLSETLSTLTMLQAIGQQSTSKSGRPTRIYDVVIDEKGQILLNGADMKNLLGAAPQKQAVGPE